MEAIITLSLYLMKNPTDVFHYFDMPFCKWKYSFNKHLDTWKKSPHFMFLT